MFRPVRVETPMQGNLMPESSKNMFRVSLSYGLSILLTTTSIFLILGDFLKSSGIVHASE
jgi:hypothetical protein